MIDMGDDGKITDVLHLKTMGPEKGPILNDIADGRHLNLDIASF